MHTNKGYRILTGSVFFMLLLLIRFYENELFYDPLLAYFKTEYQLKPLPEMNHFKLGLHLFFRYAANSLCSLGIIYCFYKNLNWVKFSAQLYGYLFVFLILSFYIVYLYLGDSNKMLLFFIRRFLIQPLFLLLFFVGFYYQSKMEK
jgi:exosortase F-associated protein